MFGFGKKKKKYFSSKVMMSRDALNTLLSAGVNTGDFLLITFFSSTQKELLLLCHPSKQEQVLSAEQVLNGSVASFIRSFLKQAGKQIVLAERYPLSPRETQVAEKLAESGTAFPFPAFAALNDLLLLRAGGEKIISLMQKMGMGETEIIEHSMIESSIEKLQEKTGAKVPAESKTHSPKEWFQLNLPG